MKKFLALMLALCMTFSLAACGSSDDDGGDASSASDASASSTEEEAGSDASSEAEGEVSSSAEGEATAADSDLKIGIVLVGDENEGYTYAHIEGIQEAAASLGISDDQILWKYSISEDESCYDACIDLVESGCTLVITNSYGHQSYCQQAASECPDVQFVALTGDTANQAGLDNFHNAFTCVYQSRYVSGVVAGMKIAELVENGELSDDNYDADGNVKIGYVGAYPYAEVVSGYTAFFLGVQSVYENVSMEVQYTNSWFDLTGEYEAAKALISDGCVIIGQHADSTGAPSACQEMYESGTTVYSVGYNIDMLSVAPDAALTSATNVWSVYYEYVFSCMLNGEEIATDWAEGYDAGAVAITALGDSCAEGTADKVAEVEAALMDGSLQVFDCSTFTIDGETPTSILIDMDLDYVGDTEGVVDGVFQESVLRSAPGFSARIDGITELN
ncbi:MAG: BMP family ABC transporter substrate-binding protein [Clostridiales bacterium]|nr:BMP family ABC transporter substrate-binding protein [Clostridiales bacterium]